jgi:hypothetical protein
MGDTVAEKNRILNEDEQVSSTCEKTILASVPDRLADRLQRNLLVVTTVFISEAQKA